MFGGVVLHVRGWHFVLYFLQTESVPRHLVSRPPLSYQALLESRVQDLEQGTCATITGRGVVRVA